MNDFDNKQICSYKDIDRFGFTCDVCGRKVNGCHYINGMSFCEKCYQETFGKDNQQNEIQQIKQQLAEKDKEIELLKHLGNHEITVEMFKENTKLIIEKRQFAISELEKVKDWLNEPFDEDGCFKIGGDLIDFIDLQIKELKGK